MSNPKEQKEKELKSNRSVGNYRAETEAKEIVDKFLKKISVRDLYRKETAKKCALIYIKGLLDEITIALSSCLTHDNSLIYLQDRKQELLEIKQEIEKL